MNDVESAVKSAVGAIKAKGMRQCKDSAGANAYTVGFLETTIARMIDMLPAAQQKRMIAELNSVSAFCVRS